MFRNEQPIILHDLYVSYSWKYAATTRIMRILSVPCHFRSWD